jgi:hypothetical protein
MRVWNKEAYKAAGPLPRKAVDLCRSQEASQVAGFFLVLALLQVAFSIPLSLF